MSLLAVVNPSRRRRRRKATRSRRRVRKMTAKQLKYFGPRRSRVTRKRRRKARTLFANPRRRRSVSRSVRRSARRRFRRNPAAVMGARAPRFRMGYLMGAVQDAAAGAGGALATDLVMTQAAQVLPDTMTSRFTGEGTLNFGYYGVKAAIAIALGFLGTQFLPGRMRGFAAKGTAGALTVQAYELARGMLPADLVLGYMTPGRNAGVARARRMGAYMRRPSGIGGLSAYLPSPGMSYAGTSETRVGEGAVQ